MSKVCIVTIRNLFCSSCLPKYRKACSDDFDIIYWDHYGLEESCEAVHTYKYNNSTNYGLLAKLKAYLAFRKYALKVIGSNNYSVVIMYPTQTALLFCDYLLFKMNKKYILDIRDYTAEKNPLFFLLMSTLVKSSGVSVITSPGYRAFLPEHNYAVAHNIPAIPSDVILQYRKKAHLDSTKAIVISFIGGVRFIEQFKRVIASFKNDNRFELRFIGRGAELLSDYCRTNNVTNVRLTGLFPENDTIKHYIETDIVMNLYGNNSPFLDYALSNKLYYAAILGMPILVCPNTYMEEVSIKYGFGFCFNLSSTNENDRLYDYYTSIDWRRFYEKCDYFANLVLREHDEYINTIAYFIKKKLDN